MIKSIIFFILCAFIGNGCISTLAYLDTKRDLEKIAIKAVDIPGGAGIGIDLSAGKILAEKPGKQFVAAVGDALLLYGGYYFYNKEKDNKEEKKEKRETNIVVNGSENNVVVINGQNNNVRTEHDESVENE